MRLPKPLRWELYPIPKGPRHRQLYGGSYFENSEWWTKPESGGHRGEAVFIAKEALFLKSVREGFRELWLWSWLLHWGLYLYLAAIACEVLGVLPGAPVLGRLAPVTWGASCLVGLVGSVGLIVLRACCTRLRTFTGRATMFNLLLLAALFASGALTFASGAARSDATMNVLRHSTIGLLHVGLVAFFLAYFPFTHMTHAYMKFFTWHGVRWDDASAIGDARAAATLAGNLQRQVRWAAPHIADGNQVTWADVVAVREEQGADRLASTK